ncbi:hypothetical protein [Actinomadura sp. DC4]|uniref:hypothetical protein n=1 Tax=Actinomadura sp. DC4 TaxID=3055069 RepID=UPI0025B0B1E3|nr:hypothetical protein [Actinomadura sp. DC4]MDN3354488.1 hypothetical protein [Actinomadura sp. DC4]
MSGPLRQQEASALLRIAGLRWISSGHCTRRSNPHCTSLDGLRPSTLDGVLQFREASRCGLVISGGTERGHSRGGLSHGAGYKLDVLPSHCVNRYVRHHYQRLHRRGDGAAVYRAPGRSLFAREPSHWDITFL